ncbi:hypothetical protein EON63_03080 [archaeon]|nr:MAG: hypothetical protein EON63_03080 [archaeon]
MIGLYHFICHYRSSRIPVVSFLSHLLCAGLLRRFHRSLVDNLEDIVHRQDMVLSTLSSQFKIKKVWVCGYEVWILVYMGICSVTLLPKSSISITPLLHPPRVACTKAGSSAVPSTC